MITPISLWIGNTPRTRCEIKDKQVAVPQRDDWIEDIKRLDVLLEYAVMHGDEAEAERLRTALRKFTEAF